MLPNYKFQISSSEDNFDDGASIDKVPGYLATEYGSEEYGNPLTPLNSCLWGLNHSNDTGTFRIKNIDRPADPEYDVVSGIFEIIEASFCFDTNMRPIIAWRTTISTCRLRYFDSTTNNYTILNLPDSVVAPTCFLDLKNPILVYAGFSDALCFYMEADGIHLSVRIQRERFQTAHPCFTIKAIESTPVITRVGKSKDNRVKLALRGLEFVSSP